MVESALFEEGEVLIQSRVRKVLELIGVRNLYPMDIIKHHILPQFTTGTWKVHVYMYTANITSIEHNIMIRYALTCIYMHVEVSSVLSRSDNYYVYTIKLGG